MGTIRVGVIGTGRMGERHCRVYGNLQGVDLVGVCDLDASRAASVAQAHGVPHFETPGELLACVDAVSIATTTPTHFELALEALHGGAHILLEKPLTATVEEGTRLVDEAERLGRVAQIGHIERFNPAYLELKNVFETDLKVIAIQVRRLSPFDSSNTDVDVVRDLMIHDLDLIVDLVGGELEDVSAFGRALNTTTVDHAVANLSFLDGPVTTLCASRVTEQKVRRIEVTAVGAYVEADLLDKSVTIHRRMHPVYDAAKYRQESVIEKIHVPSDEPLMLELRHFVDCIRDGKPSAVPIRDGLCALRLAQTICDQLVAGEERPPSTSHFLSARP